MRPYEPLLAIIAIGKMSKSGSWIIGKDLLSTRTTGTDTVYYSCVSANSADVALSQSFDKTNMFSCMLMTGSAAYY